MRVFLPKLTFFWSKTDDFNPKSTSIPLQLNMLYILYFCSRPQSHLFNFEPHEIVLLKALLIPDIKEYRWNKVYKVCMADFLCQVKDILTFKTFNCSFHGLLNFFDSPYDFVTNLPL